MITDVCSQLNTYNNICYFFTILHTSCSAILANMERDVSAKYVYRDNMLHWDGLIVAPEKLFKFPRSELPHRRN